MQCLGRVAERNLAEPARLMSGYAIANPTYGTLGDCRATLAMTAIFSDAHRGRHHQPLYCLLRPCP